ncbi:hypothetical protein B0I35DRAFT_365240 [Stachybotrys elegans]|uniref:Uncharacterized protein n=1 Tax=Stachybotrys elegans TaxID=80388 RepID=A0A8K0SGV1_9HYPO|nr:hypothetical protein B0I35DRAFT_365240 [Stachybotrys elegans]
MGTEKRGSGRRHLGSTSDGPGRATQRPEKAALTSSAVAAHPVLGYKIRVLIHDFVNLTKDNRAASRLNQTTDKHYISRPYFEDNEAAVIKDAVVDVDVNIHHIIDAPEILGEDGGETEQRADEAASDTLKGLTVHAALETILQNFTEKRRASGDARPCGPHQLAPMYASLFGIGLEEIRDEKFLTRLRRSSV